MIEMESNVLEQRSEKPERQKMPVTVNDARQIMRSAISDCAWPADPGQPRKVWLGSVARAVGISFNRLYDIYIGETVPRWHEGATILAKAEEKRRQIARWRDGKAACEIEAIDAEISRMDRRVSKFEDDCSVGSRPAHQQD
jgi:hypothetical protein